MGNPPEVKTPRWLRDQVAGRLGSLKEKQVFHYQFMNNTIIHVWVFDQSGTVTELFFVWDGLTFGPTATVIMGTFPRTFEEELSRHPDAVVW